MPVRDCQVKESVFAVSHICAISGSEREIVDQDCNGLSATLSGALPISPVDGGIITNLLILKTLRTRSLP